MSTETLTVERARELLVRAIEEKGEDYVYEAPVPRGCAYFHETPEGWTPGCIVGHVFNYLGINRGDLGGNNTGSSAVHAIRVVLKLPADSRAVAGLVHAQEVQDVGQPWKEALAAFDKAVFDAGV